MRVLVVDDAAVSRAAFGTMAAAAGHVVVAEAGDAERGLALARDHAPDVVVVDGRLPPDGGVAFVERLRASGSRAAIVVIAALGETALVRAAVAAGAAGAVLRPFVPSRVADALAARGCIPDQ